MLTNSNAENEFNSPQCWLFSPHESRSVYEFEGLTGGDDLISQLYIFSSFAFPCNSFHALRVSKPDFPERDMLLQLFPCFPVFSCFPFFPFFSGFLVVFIITPQDNSFHPRIVVIYLVLIFYVLFMCSKAEFYNSTDQSNPRLSKMIQQKLQLHQNSYK